MLETPEFPAVSKHSQGYAGAIAGRIQATRDSPPALGGDGFFTAPA